MTPMRRRFHIAAYLKFTALCGAFLALFRIGGGHDTDDLETFLYPVAAALCCTLALMWSKAKPSRCRACGRTASPLGDAGPDALCPACRVTTLPPERRRRQEVRGLILLALLLLVASTVMAWPFSDWIEARFGRSGHAAIIVVLSVVQFVVYGGVMVVRYLVGAGRMANAGHALEVARTCAREAGRDASFGPASVHVFGPGDPVPMLRDQMEACRGRFEELLGAPIPAEAPFRVFAFGTREAFDAFYRRLSLSWCNLDGVYVPWSTRTLVFTTEFPAYRLADPERLLRVLLTYHHLDAFKKVATPRWLQAGLGYALACGGDEDELSRLHRRMRASLARRGTLGSADLFHARPSTIVKLARDWQEHGSFARYTQFVDQSWSVVEYLRDVAAAEGAPGRFLGVLSEIGAAGRDEEVLLRHYGCGFDGLLERWRGWVGGHVNEVHGPPPSRMRDALLERVLPIVRDREAEPIDRVQGIREMGRTGYVLGADALIEMLGVEDLVSEEELVWALEAISGLALGHERRRWEAWWERLPQEATGLAMACGRSSS